MQTFTLTDEHVTLLRNASVWWWDCEYGAPCIDPKRPYGDSDVEKDIARVLGIKWKRDEDDDYLPIVVRETVARLHKETQIALQVVLAAGSFEPGEYVADDHRRNWRPVR